MKAYNLFIKEEAKVEIVDAYNWYERKQLELGERFIVVLDDYFKNIRSTPKQFPIKHKSKRQATIKEFPYIIIFEIEDNDIIIYAIFNTNQNPNKWRK